MESRLGVTDGAVETGDAPSGQTFWVLDALRQRLAGVEGGGVVLAGSVETPGGPAEWQYGMATEDLLDLDDVSAENVSTRLAALGHRTRIALLLAVLGGRASTAALAELDGMGTTGQVYHHIRILTTAGWLRSTARGRVEVPAERVVPLLIALTAAL